MSLSRDALSHSEHLNQSARPHIRPPDKTDTYWSLDSDKVAMGWLAYVGVFPLLSSVFAILAFFIGYGIAVSKDHVDAWLPFISDCGARPPESGIFGQLLNFSAFFFAITCFFLHICLMKFYEKEHDRHLIGWKNYSFVLMAIGFIAATGASMVANFQEGHYLATHDTGAFMFFIGITIYFWGQVIMAAFLRPHYVNIALTIFRAILCLCITGLLIFHMVCLFASPFVDSVNGVKPPAPSVDEWGIQRFNSSSDPYYNNHLATTISEWILALFIEFFVITYVYDLSIHRITRQMKQLNDQTKSLTEEADKIYYSHQVGPLGALPPRSHDYSMDDEEPIRRLPRVDPYGTYNRSHAGTVHSYAQQERPYNQYQYY